MRCVTQDECAGETRAIPLDRAYLEEQWPDLRGRGDHGAQYLAHGLRRGINPTRFFLTDWYAWQNPDWSERHASPYLHYLDRGRREGRDPSPFVDVVKYQRATGGAVPNERIYGAILDGYRAPALGVYDSEADLEGAQRAFLNGITYTTHRMRRADSGRRALVVCQTGRGALIDGWIGAADRTWDLLLNYYDAAGMREGAGEYVVFQKGTKFTAMSVLLDRFRALFAQYDHVLFIDDDVETSARDLDRLFAACRRHDLDLAQMALTPESSCNWPHLFARPKHDVPRAVSAVEIMMPVFSRRALDWIAPTLGQSVSGFGLDLVWGKIVSENGGRIAVVDEVAAVHARPVDQCGGAYYDYLRRHGINAKAELWTMLTRYGASRELTTA